MQLPAAERGRRFLASCIFSVHWRKKKKGKLQATPFVKVLFSSIWECLQARFTSCQSSFHLTTTHLLSWVKYFKRCECCVDILNQPWRPGRKLAVPPLNQKRREGCKSLERSPPSKKLSRVIQNWLGLRESVELFSMVNELAFGSWFSPLTNLGSLSTPGPFAYV